MMEGLSGSKYQVFAVGSRPRALATAMKDWATSVRSAVAQGQWRDESQIEPAHLLILDGDADLVSAGQHDDDEAGALLDHILWADAGAELQGAGVAELSGSGGCLCDPHVWGDENRAGDAGRRPRGAGHRSGWDLLCLDDGGGRQLLRGISQCGRLDGLTLVEQSLRDALSACAGAPTDISNLDLQVPPFLPPGVPASLSAGRCSPDVWECSCASFVTPLALPVAGSAPRSRQNG